MIIQQKKLQSYHIAYFDTNSEYFIGISKKLKITVLKIMD